jgi:hypothetical protein
VVFDFDPSDMASIFAKEMGLPKPSITLPRRVPLSKAYEVFKAKSIIITATQNFLNILSLFLILMFYGDLQLFGNKMIKYICNKL